jgi:hypothetical protein
MQNNDIFEPFERLIEIEILGKKHQVPDNNTLLRCFQYLWMETVSYGDYCWNGNCANCRIWLEDSESEKSVLACRARAAENMKIVRLSREIVKNKEESE